MESIPFDIQQASFIALAVVLVFVIGAFLIVRALRLPPSFDANQEKRRALRKALADQPQAQQQPGREEQVMDQLSEDKK